MLNLFPIAADVNLMGYANPAQIAAGLHFRLRARAFIVADPAPNGERVVFVNLDSCMGEQAVTDKVVERLKQRYSPLLIPPLFVYVNRISHLTR